jgi:hypothetical protein
LQDAELNDDEKRAKALDLKRNGMYIPMHLKCAVSAALLLPLRLVLEHFADGVAVTGRT